ncbi:unnamed protein product [Pseudo-nitzschia multistriata]|uniref:Uncharacterized protein n=1 Tax=Pseudo-nitzschia multistriata TaxID=183589 RepID=A0A448YWT4_9STRA|nr:unnamed protein product [Pseudo-nitzschia multistriata]
MPPVAPRGSSYPHRSEAIVPDAYRAFVVCGGGAGLRYTDGDDGVCACVCVCPDRSSGGRFFRERIDPVGEDVPPTRRLGQSSSPVVGAAAAAARVRLRVAPATAEARIDAAVLVAVRVRGIVVLHCIPSQNPAIDRSSVGHCHSSKNYAYEAENKNTFGYSSKEILCARHVA